MNFQQALAYAREHTNVIRVRKNLLYTFGATRLPYICLSDAPEKASEVVLRKGVITADRPQISIPGEELSFEGFGEDEEERVLQVLFARRIEMPAAKYVNETDAALKVDGPLDKVTEKTVDTLEQENDSRTAVLQAPDEVWNLAILLYVGSQVVRSAPSNIAEHFERLFRQRGGPE